MRFIGYLCRSNVVPAPLVALGQEGNTYYAIFPGTEPQELEGVDSADELFHRSTYICPPVGCGDNIPALSYALTRDKVVFGEGVSVRRKLKRVVACDNIDSDTKYALRSFISEIENAFGPETADVLSELIEANEYLLFYVTQRKLKKKYLFAKTLLIQTTCSGNIKTLYRKGCKFSQELNEVKIPSRVADFFTSYAPKRSSCPTFR